MPLGPVCTSPIASTLCSRVSVRCDVFFPSWYAPSLNCDGEKFYDTVNGNPCHMNDQLDPGEGATNVPLP